MLLLSSRACWKIHFEWCIYWLWFHLQQNNESSWCCDGVNIFMQYIVRHMGIQVFSVLVEFKRKLLDMHFTYIRYSVQIGTMYENISTCQLRAVSKDEISVHGILDLIILSHGAFQNKEQVKNQKHSNEMILKGLRSVFSPWNCLCWQSWLHFVIELWQGDYF